MATVIFLGDNSQYLTFKCFHTMDEAYDYVERVQNVVEANIERKLSLKERSKLLKSEHDYHAFIFRTIDFEIIDEDFWKGK